MRDRFPYRSGCITACLWFPLQYLRTQGVLVVRFDLVHRGQHPLRRSTGYHLVNSGSRGKLLISDIDVIGLILKMKQFQGLGAGGNNAMVSVIVTDMVALHERATYLGYISMSGAVATVSGSIIGAAISDKANWRM